MYNFYKGKKVLITGHTGFKGSWMVQALLMLGADVTGYSLEPPTNPNLFKLLNLSDQINSVIGDVRDLELLKKTFEQSKPEIVIHMAAQPLVRESYLNPVSTYEINVMGTVNVMECVRQFESVRSFVNVTTDKVYLNKEWVWPYRESDELNGYDPYSNSKSCSELVTSSYKNSFFSKDNEDWNKSGVGSSGLRICAISTCRAGNVIGGGDFAKDRIIPDCIRASSEHREIIVRNPHSTRPYQHVLEPVMAYLMIAMKQYEDSNFAGNYNIGPEEGDCKTTAELVTLFCDKWNEYDMDFRASWSNKSDGGPHEANILKLDCAKIKSVFGWKPVWNSETAIEKIVEWNKAFINQDDMASITRGQIKVYCDKKNFL